MSNISETAKIFQRVRITDSTISDGAVVADDCDLKNVDMGIRSEFGRRCVVRNTTIGPGSYTGSNCSLVSVDIGKYCCISSDVNIYGVAKTRSHNYKHASMYTPYWFHRVLDVDTPNSAEMETTKAVIGSDVWIGCNVSIVGDIQIGHGAVIGAGAVVISDVAPYTIVAGNPAREIKKRFSDNLVERLLKLQWWNFDMDRIKQVAHLLCVDLDEQILEEIEKALGGKP